MASWVGMLGMLGVSKKPSELTRTAMVRARTCETLAERLGRSDTGNRLSRSSSDAGAIEKLRTVQASKPGREFTFGRHVFLRCHQLEAVGLLEQHIAELEQELERHQMGVVEVRESGVTYRPPRYETD